MSKKNSKIEFNHDVASQDNDALNSFIKTMLGKIIFIFNIILYIIIMIFFVNWKSVYNNNIAYFQTVLSIICILGTFITYIISKINIHKIENGFKKVDYDYYRNILYENATGVLSFVYNKNLNYKNVMVSSLLKFDKEKIIKINYNNHNIEFLSTDFDMLCEYERYLLLFMKSESKNKIVNFADLKNIISDYNFKNNIKELIKKDVKNKNYFKTKSIFSNILVYVLFISMFISFFDIFKNNSITEASVICMANTIIIGLLTIVTNQKIYFRTRQGKILSDKLYGLNNYLKDFSVINDREIHEIIVWDYYLVYAII